MEKFSARATLNEYLRAQFKHKNSLSSDWIFKQTSNKIARILKNTECEISRQHTAHNNSNKGRWEMLILLLPCLAVAFSLQNAYVAR